MVQKNNMDKIDEKIIKELDENPRTYLTQLAKKVRISQQVADYRIKRMLQKRDIIKFGTVVNLKSLQQEHYKIFFTFESHKKYSNEEIFDFLKKRKGVYWSARIGGKYDLHITLFVFDFEELDQFIDEFNKKFPDLVKDFKTCYVLEHFMYNHKFFNSKARKINYGYKDLIVKIDSLDKQILEKIKDNCRLSAFEIAKGKNISYKTVLNRIKSLEKRKIILGYRLFIKSTNFKPYIVLISFKDYSKDEEKKLLNYLGDHHALTQTVRLFGIWNLFLHVRTKSAEHLQEIIIDFRNKFNIIDEIEIIPIFEDVTINLMPL